MPRVLAFLLAIALLFQTSWAAAATYCGHESTPGAAAHFGHHEHVHKSADGQKQPGGKLAVDDDCAGCHAAHPALACGVTSCVACVAPSEADFPQPLAGDSAAARAPDRPQWPRLA